MRGQRAELQSNDPVYMYAGQKLNFYENQMKEFRKKMDPNTIYTYGKEQYRLAIDPYNIDEQKKKQL